MADAFVSQTATNGYVVGDDANDGLSESTPKLTIESAITAVGIGDTININDGTYVDATNYLFSSKASVAFMPVNDYAVTIQGVAGQTRVVHVAASNNTFGKVIIDANSNISRCITVASTVTGTTFSGTKFTGATESVSSSILGTNVTFNNGFIIDLSEFTSHCLEIDVDAAGFVKVQDGTIITSNSTIGSAAKQIIRVTPSVTGVDLTISGNTFNVTDAAGKGTTMVYGDGCSNYTVEDNVVSGTGDDRGTFCNLVNHATFTTDSCSIRRNTGGLTLAGTPAGYLIGVGSEATGTGDNSISNIEISNNDLHSADHGYWVGFNTGAKVYGNKSTNTDIGLVSKGDIDSEFYGNLVIECVSSALYSKGSSGTKFSNNVHVISTGFDSISQKAGVNALVNSANIEYKNNITYATVSPTKCTEVDALNTATFTNNIYHYTGGAIPANSFNYQAVNYASLAAWEAAEATASDNQEIDPDLNASYEPYSSSPCIGAGVKWWSGANLVGFNGEPFSDFGIDIGYIQSTHGPFHPVNL